MLASVIVTSTHPLLDWTNNYGIRLLLPWNPRWFYGDAVFIIDPWLWLMLAAGVIVARRRRTLRPARIALFACAVYVAALVWSSRAARTAVGLRPPSAGTTGAPPRSRSCRHARWDR